MLRRRCRQVAARPVSFCHPIITGIFNRSAVAASFLCTPDPTASTQIKHEYTDYGIVKQMEERKGEKRIMELFLCYYYVNYLLLVVAPAAAIGNGGSGKARGGGSGQVTSVPLLLLLLLLIVPNLAVPALLLAFLCFRLALDFACFWLFSFFSRFSKLETNWASADAV